MASIVSARLFLEEICCNLCRFQHVAEDGVAPEAVRIDQECYLGLPKAFADIRVQVPGAAPYFVEVDWGLGDFVAPDRIASHYDDAFMAAVA